MAFAVAWYPPKPVTRATATGPGTRVSRRGRPAQTPRPCQATPTRVRFPLAAAGRAASQGDGSSAPGSCRGPQGVESHDRRVVLVGLTTSFAAGGSAQARGSVLKEEVVGGRTMITTASGVKYADIAIGSGSPIRTGSVVVANAVGTLEDKTEFLNTYETGVPITFSLGVRPGNVTEGLEEGLEGMNAGGRRLIVVPPSLGYGQRVRSHNHAVCARIQQCDAMKADAASPAHDGIFVLSPSVALIQGAKSRRGAAIPGNAILFYDVELLRCLNTPSGAGLACCSERSYPCAVPAEQ